MADTDQQLNLFPNEERSALGAYYTSSKYLRNKGWKPSPSSLYQSVWQHENLSCDKAMFADLYEPGRFRLHHDDAIQIQLIIDKKIIPDPNFKYPITVFWDRL